MKAIDFLLEELKDKESVNCFETDGNKLKPCSKTADEVREIAQDNQVQFVLSVVSLRGFSIGIFCKGGGFLLVQNSILISRDGRAYRKINGTNKRAPEFDIKVKG